MLVHSKWGRLFLYCTVSFRKYMYAYIANTYIMEEGRFIFSVIYFLKWLNLVKKIYLIRKTMIRLNHINVQPHLHPLFYEVKLLFHTKKEE